MQITFAGVVIGAESPEGGTDAITGFSRPRGTQNVQWKEPLRATDATPIARGNRKQFLSGTIMPAPSDTLQDAMILRGLMFTNLPQTGALVLLTGTLELTYQFAVLTEFQVMENANGVAVGYKATFAVGPGVQSSLPIATEAGLDVETEDGKTIIN